MSTLMRHTFLLAAALSLPLSSRAQDSSPPPAAETPPGRLMQPGNLDLRATGDTDILLVYVDVGLGADFGLLPAGPGTLSVGAEVDFGFCASFCLALNALTGLRWGMRDFAPFARVGYDLPLGGSTNASKLDAYGVGMIGPVIASLGVSNADNTASITGTDTALGVGLGAGLNYFMSDNLFAGAEARLRYAQGVYEITARVGNISISDEQRSWSLSGINLLVFVGLRL